MDMFDFFDSPHAIKKIEAPKKSFGSLVNRKGLVVSLRQASVLFFDDEAVKEVFVPVSLIKDWWFTTDGTKRGLGLGDLELDDEVTLVIPKWLAKKEKLL